MNFRPLAQQQSPRNTGPFAEMGRPGKMSAQFRQGHSLTRQGQKPEQKGTLAGSCRAALNVSGSYRQQPNLRPNGRDGSRAVAQNQPLRARVCPEVEGLKALPHGLTLSPSLALPGAGIGADFYATQRSRRTAYAIRTVEGNGVCGMTSRAMEGRSADRGSWPKAAPIRKDARPAHFGGTNGN